MKLFRVSILMAHLVSFLVMAGFLLIYWDSLIPNWMWWLATGFALLTACSILFNLMFWNKYQFVFFEQLQAERLSLIMGRRSLESKVLELAEVQRKYLKYFERNELKIEEPQLPSPEEVIARIKESLDELHKPH